MDAKDDPEPERATPMPKRPPGKKPPPKKSADGTAKKPPPKKAPPPKKKDPAAAAAAPAGCGDDKAEPSPPAAEEAPPADGADEGEEDFDDMIGDDGALSDRVRTHTHNCVVPCFFCSMLVVVDLLISNFCFLLLPSHFCSSRYYFVSLLMMLFPLLRAHADYPIIEGDVVGIELPPQPAGVTRLIFGSGPFGVTVYGTGNGLVVTHVEPEGSGAEQRVEVRLRDMLY